MATAEDARGRMMMIKRTHYIHSSSNRRSCCSLVGRCLFFFINALKRSDQPTRNIVEVTLPSMTPTLPF